MNIRILLADDHRITRQGLRALLDKEDDIEVVEEADNGRAAVDLAESLEPDVVVMDISMPDLNGIEATRQIVSRTENVRVLILSMHSDRQHVAQTLGAGASGYVLKDSAFAELAEAIRRVHQGSGYLSPGVTGDLITDYAERMNRSDQPSSASLLTPKEREVLQLVAEGHTTKEIAARLHVSPKTVETHRQHIMEKLGLRAVADLTKYAIREGLTSLEG
jgi:DNA-binding NarL/FixJ family response regulator